MKGDVVAGYSSIGGRKMEDDYCKVSSGKYFVMVVGEGMVEIQVVKKAAVDEF